MGGSNEEKHLQMLQFSQCVDAAAAQVVAAKFEVSKLRNVGGEQNHVIIAHPPVAQAQILQVVELLHVGKGVPVSVVRLEGLVTVWIWDNFQVVVAFLFNV